MPKIYHKLYDAAKLDTQAAVILNENNLHAPAIYHCAQAAEKCMKATLGCYLSKIKKFSDDEIVEKFKEYGHDLRESYKENMKFLLKIYIDSLYKDKEEAYEQLRHRIFIPQLDTLDIRRKIRQFDELVDILYQDYIQIKKGSFEGFEEELKLITKELLDKEYFRYMLLIMRLSAFLTPFEEYSRYPKKELSYNNVFLLNKVEHIKAIRHICAMIYDALNLAPSIFVELPRYFKNK